MLTTPPKDCRFLGITFTFSSFQFKILLPAIIRGMSPHWANHPTKNRPQSQKFDLLAQKIKGPPPLHLQPPCAPPADISLSFWCCRKKAKGTSILERY